MQRDETVARLSSLRVREYMREAPAVVRPDAGVTSAIELLLREGRPAVAVVDQSGEVVGVMSVRDCLKYLVAAHYANRPLGAVRNFMSRVSYGARWVTPDTSLLEVAAGFIDSDARCLPVMENGRLLGQINSIDVLRAASSSAGKL